MAITVILVEKLFLTPGTPEFVQLSPAFLFLSFLSFLFFLSTDLLMFFLQSIKPHIYRDQRSLCFSGGNNFGLLRLTTHNA